MAPITGRCVRIEASTGLRVGGERGVSSYLRVVWRQRRWRLYRRLIDQGQVERRIADNDRHVSRGMQSAGGGFER